MWAGRSIVVLPVIPRQVTPGSTSAGGPSNRNDSTPHEVLFPSPFGGAAYAIAGQQGGSISAEHGIGSIKREFLHHSRSAAELALMRLLKSSLDPKGILNPGKVV
jgi:hypothetical protein